MNFYKRLHLKDFSHSLDKLVRCKIGEGQITTRIVMKGIQLIWITVSNIQASIDFYTKVIGFTLLEFHEHFGWAELSGPEGIRLGLAQYSSMSDSKPGSNAIPTITVENLEQTLALKNVKLIGEVLEIPGEVKMQTFSDADGNTFQFCQLLK